MLSAKLAIPRKEVYTVVCEVGKLHGVVSFAGARRTVWSSSFSRISRLSFPPQQGENAQTIRAYMAASAGHRVTPCSLDAHFLRTLPPGVGDSRLC
jgi:hypothetical protein